MREETDHRHPLLHFFGEAQRRRPEQEQKQKQREQKQREQEQQPKQNLEHPQLKLEQPELEQGLEQLHSKVLVAVSLGSESLELFSWAVTVACRPGDTVVAVHLLRDSDSEIRSIEKQYQRARAGVLSLLEQCRDLCHFRQVTANVRIVPTFHGPEKVLLEQATLLNATTLVLNPSDVAPADSELRGFAECTDQYPSPPPGCVVFVAQNRRMRSKRLTSSGVISVQGELLVPDLQPSSLHLSQEQQRNESVQRLLPQKGAQSHVVSDPALPSSDCSKGVHVRLDIPSDYSPRGVLEGPNSGSNDGGVSPEESSGSSPGFPLLVSSSTGNAAGRVEDEQADDFQASCLNLFRHMKRQNTFPAAATPGSTGPRHRRLIPSFSCSSAPNGMGFSSYNSDEAAALSLHSICESGDKSPWRCFTYDELLLATSCFSPANLVGKGGYAVVYRGTLSTGQLIAVKKLIKGDSEQHKEGGFLTELGIIGHVRHPNTTPLIGFCVERGLHLVFPFSPIGSLASVLHGAKSKALEWSVRQRIAVGTARGLHYLHKVCPRRIIHRDIKASNILLGPDFEPQISDFGLAKWLPEQWTHHTVTPIEGTFGYLAPEYFMHGIVDEKTDVFAYGVLLLELLTGRKPIDAMQRNIVVWARPYLESCSIQELVDPTLSGAYDSNQLRRLVLVATLCVRQSPLWRPCMGQVLKLLSDETLDQQLPTSWSTLVCNATDVDDEYTSNEYHTDMNRHRALALGT